MKKGIALLLILAMMLSVCAVGASAEEQVTITFGFWGDTPEANMKMQLAENYMAMHPNVNIEFEYTDGNGYLTKMQTWFSSGTTPDVFGVASDVLTYFINQDEFENLAPYIEADGLEGSWNQNIIDSSYTNAKGEIVAAPFISKVFAMAYNKDLFDEAGIDYPTDDWTVDDMIEAARAITKGKGVDAVYGLRWGVRPTEFYRNLYGTPVYDLNTNEIHAADNEEFKAAVSLFVDTIKEGLAPNETGGALSTGGFETGRFGMQLSATWDIATLLTMAESSFDWDIVMLPINTDFDKRMLSTFRGNGWCISKDAENKDVAWDFIKYMTTTEEAMRLAQAFGIPELTSFAESEEYLTDFSGSTAIYDKSVFLRMLDFTTNFSNMGVYAQINDVIKNDYELFLADQMTVDEMAEDVQVQAESLMAMQ